MSPYKSEALKALAHLQKRLDDPDPLEGLARFQLTATVQYATQQVELIRELKRVRSRPRAETP